MTSPKAYPPELTEILRRGHAGDPAALPELQRVFDDHPELVDELGNLARNAETALLGLIAGRSVTGQEAIRRSLDVLRQELLATVSSPLGRLLVERVILAHAWVSFADADLAARLAREPGSSPACRAAVKRLDQSQNRFLAAVKTLAVFQKLLPRSLSPVQLLAKPVVEGPGESVPRAVRRRRNLELAVKGVD